MLSLPSHKYDQYEPLHKHPSTFLGKVYQRRLLGLVVVLVTFLGGVHLYRVRGDAAYDGGWNPSSHHSAGSLWNATTITITEGHWWGGGGKGAVAAATAASSSSWEVEKIIEDAKIASSIPISKVANPLASSSESKQTASYEIDEADWHMPSDVVLDSKDARFRTRLQPYFRQELHDIHREKGYGTPVDLHEAPFIRRSLYRHLLESFQQFSQAHDFHFWLAHGTLLGQKWGQKIMTGDTDVDLQCSLGALHRVAKFQNTLWDGRFELVVNPHYLIRRTRNFRGLGIDKNVIDARWIDVLTGHYIDITALSSLQADRPVLDVAPFEGERRAKKVQDKSPHHYNVESISPSRPCRFEGMDMWCPNSMQDVLDEEYKQHDLPHFQTWRFNDTLQAFTEVTCKQIVAMYLSPDPYNCDKECRSVVRHERHLNFNHLVMHGDNSVTSKGCILKVSYTDHEDNKVTREYWGRAVPTETIPWSNARNVTYPPVVL
jgi:hypothetical protein